MTPQVKFKICNEIKLPNVVYRSRLNLTIQLSSVVIDRKRGPYHDNNKCYKNDKDRYKLLAVVP